MRLMRDEYGYSYDPWDHRRSQEDEADRMASGADAERVVQIIFEEFGDANNLATGKRKAGRIHKIILYGSYALRLGGRAPHR